MLWKLHLRQERHIFHPYYQASFFSHLEHVHKQCSQNSKVIYCWFPPTPSFLKCHVLNIKSRSSIQRMNALIYCLKPKTLWNVPFWWQVSYHAENGFIFPLWYIILLRWVGSCKFPSNTLFVTKNFKFFLTIFSPTINTQSFDDSLFHFQLVPWTFKCAQSF